VNKVPLSFDAVDCTDADKRQSRLRAETFTRMYNITAVCADIILDLI